jgi:predicted nucleic acid-binding protein
VTLAFWDSSGFLKLLIEEPGRDLAVDVWGDAGDVVASRLAVPEVSAAIARAHRAGRLNDRSEREARRRWTRYLDAVAIVELTRVIGNRAASLAAEHSLSGADAVHLASALSLGAVSPLVVTWDHRLASAADAVGLAVVPSPT